LDYGIQKQNILVLNAYTDADWEGSIDDRKITSGGEFFLGKFLVAWPFKK
jgi:hypothetical protein